MIALSASEDRFHDMDMPGSYEWSYYDGLSEDGRWGFVAIWFRGCPMSPYYTAAIDRSIRNGSQDPPYPADYCAFNFSLYHRGSRVYSALHELPGIRIGPGADVALGASSMTATGDGEACIDLDTTLPWQAARAVGRITLQHRPQQLDAIGCAYDPTARGHFWVPAALDGRFDARIALWRLGRGTRHVRFSGRCYHDRNFGTGPLHHLKADWHWGRVHSGEKVFVYFSVLPDNREEPSFQRLVLLDEGTLVHHSSRCTSLESSRHPHWSTLPRASSLGGSEPGGGISFESRRIAAIDSGPFYHRMLSNVVVRRQGGVWLEAQGITEFLRPPRLGVAAFRPFVKFRVRRTTG